MLFLEYCNMNATRQITIIILVAAVYLECNLVDSAIYAHNRENKTLRLRDQTPYFGPDIGQDELRGILIRAEPYDACGPVKPPPFSLNREENITTLQFALVRKGLCDFGLKVLHTQLAGYDAAIVHNVGSNELVKMSSDDSYVANAIFIPSFFIGQDSAIILNSTYLYQDGGEPFIEIKEDQFNPVYYYLVPFVIVVAACFISLLCFLLIKCQCDRRRARRGRLSRERLKKLPVKKYNKGDEYDVCAICLEDYEEGDSLRVLPCAHAYHCKCVDPWLTNSKRVCPLCKRRVLSGDGSSLSEEDEGNSSDDEHSPLVPTSVAASPNAPMYATGYGRQNPFTRHQSFNRRASSSSDGTSTDASDTELVPARQHPPRRAFLGAQGRKEFPCSSGLRSQHVHQPNYAEPEILRVMGGHEPADADTYLNSAEVMMAGPSRISESSIIVLSDAESSQSTSEPHSYSSQEFHSLNGSMTVAQIPINLESRASAIIGSNEDDDSVIVIAGGSRAEIYADDSGV